jgi:hypothetical protein
MLRKQLIIATFASFALLATFGTAFAENSHDKSILGTDEFVFNAPETKADVAARNYVYDHAQLALIGTENGGEIASTPKALLAASSYGYDQQALADVGTERGISDFNFNDQNARTGETVADKNKVLCANC